MPKAKKRTGILPRAASAAKPQKQPKQQAQQAAARRSGSSSASSGKQGAKRRADAASSHPAAKRQRQEPAQAQQQQQWYCRSVIDRQAADAVAKLVRAAETQRSGATIKSLTLAPHVVHKKATFAVLPVLKQLVAHAGLLEQYSQLPKACAHVVAYELLFGQGVREFGPVEAAVSKVQPLMRAHLKQLMQDAGVDSPEGLLASTHGDQQQPAAVPHPRTARVNTLRTTVAAALQQLQDDGFEDARVDELLPDLLVLAPGTDLHDHSLVRQGALILQSKASCMPAHALHPQPDWTVLDCCAAPGNKTTHVAALVGPSGRVLAYDKDPKRLKRLRANAKAAGAVNIEAECADFLSLDLSDPRFAEVKGVILDPSCSGSGTVVSRMDHLLPRSTQEDTDGAAGDDTDAQRVEQLARFQEAALRHGLTLPALQRLAYSTCSVHQRENEDVVAAVLPTARALGFQLVPALPAWHRRGLPAVQGSEMLLRTDAHEDGTDGFFVAVFERTGARQQQQQQQQQQQGDAGAALVSNAAARSSKTKKRRRQQA